MVGLAKLAFNFCVGCRDRPARAPEVQMPEAGAPQVPNRWKNDPSLSATVVVGVGRARLPAFGWCSVVVLLVGLSAPGWRFGVRMTGFQLERAVYAAAVLL